MTEQVMQRMTALVTRVPPRACLQDHRASMDKEQFRQMLVNLFTRVRRRSG